MSGPLVKPKTGFRFKISGWRQTGEKETGHCRRRVIVARRQAPAFQNLSHPRTSSRVWSSWQRPRF